MAVKRGKFYAVGVGPGDAELITIRAAKILERCPVIAAPQTKNGGMTALSIAAQAVDLSEKEILPLPFAMSRDAAERRALHEASAEKISAVLASGRDVAMPVLGDTAIYASCASLLALLRSGGNETEQIPGVPSFCAAAAALGRSLTEMDAPLHIVPAGTADLEEALAWPGSKVLMKAGQDYGRVLAELKARGLSQKAALAANCGLAGETLCRTLDEAPEESGYFTLFLVPAEHGEQA